MTEARFDLLFRGDITMGSQLVQVKQNLMRLFKLDEAKVNGLFSGQAVVLKRDLDSDAAEKYLKVLTQAGAQVEKVAAGSVKPRAAAPARREPVKKMSMAERLAAEAAAVDTAAPKVSGDAGTRVESEPGESDKSAAFTLAPVGSDLLEQKERSQVEAVVVDTSGLSLRELEGDLLDANEKMPVVVIDLPEPEFDLAETGADLLSPSEKQSTPVPTVQLADWDMAPAGEDLGQIKRPPAPPAPDTSQLRLLAED